MVSENTVVIGALGKLRFFVDEWSAVVKVKLNFCN
jgi:hypothetical protein